MPDDLLSLPRELRDMIIELVLDAHAEPPKRPRIYNTRRNDSGTRTALRVFDRPPTLPAFKQYNAYGLLLTNQQLHDETNDRLHQLPPLYSLDLMMMGNNARELRPTWICCPVRSTGPIESVSINVRDAWDTPELYLERLRDTLLDLDCFSALLVYIVRICCPGEWVKTVKLNLEIPSEGYRNLSIDDFQMGYFGGPAYRLSELPPRTLGKFRNNQNEVLRILAYQYTFASLSVPEDLLDAGYTVWWDWEEELDNLIITVDGYQKAELARW